MTSNKLPPLPEPSDDDLPVPITYGIRRKGEAAVIGVVPAKVHGNPPNSKQYIRDFEEVPLFTSEQLHAAREQAFHDGQCEAPRQSQSRPAGEDAPLDDELSRLRRVEDQYRAIMLLPAGAVDALRQIAAMCPATCEMTNEHAMAQIAAGALDALQADAREKGEAVAWRVDTPYGYGYTFAEEMIDYMNGRDPEPRWPADRAPEALARLREYLADLSYPDGSDPLDDLSAVALATQPAQASEKDGLKRLRGLSEAASQDWRGRKNGVIVGGPFHEYTNGSAQSQIAMFTCPVSESDVADRQQANADFALACVAYVRAALATSSQETASE